MISFLQPVSTFELFWVGVHKLDDVTIIITHGSVSEATNPRSARNREWQALARSADMRGATLLTELHGPFSGRSEAASVAAMLDQFSKAVCRPEASYDPNADNRVVLVSGPNVGAIFANAYQAAQNYDLDPGAVYRQLSGKPGFRTVKGHKFAYVRDLNDEMKQQLNL